MGTARHKDFEDLMRRIDVTEEDTPVESAPAEPIPFTQHAREWRVWGRSPNQPISLFAGPPQAGQRPTSFLASFVAHTTVIGLVLFGAFYGPRIRVSPLGPRMLIRQVDLDTPDARKVLAGGSGAFYPDQDKATTTNPAAEAVKAQMASSRPKLPVRTPAPQTIVQPDIDVSKMVTQKIPMPAMLLWNANRPKVKTITPPKPQQLSTNSVIPKIERPNQAQHLADIAISSTAFSSNHAAQMPSTTTPIVLPGAQHVDQINETSTVQIAEASAANVASISDLAMKQGVVALPAVNQVAPGNGGAGTATDGNGNGQNDKSGAAGNGAHGSGAGHAGASTGAGGGNSTGKGDSSGKGTGTSKGNGSTQSAGNGTGFDGPAPTAINRPKEGQFAAVAVGNTAADDYPQTALFWTNRIVYTVFLHVGVPQTWILQYSVPRANEAADTGNNKHLAAPWPYYILRPNFDPNEVRADAVIVHGFISTNGHFENLDVVFPKEVGRSQAILKQIGLWQFKPATDNGQPTRVEILLIIPQGD